MKFVLTIFFTFFATYTFAASEQVSTDRTITQLRTYGNVALVYFTPSFENSQNCSNTGKNTFQVNFDSQTGKEMYASLLAAASSKQKVGFGIEGCAGGGYPIIYRVDVRY